MTKIALVTGGTRGIGEAISKKLKNDGHTVVVNYGNNEEAAKEFSEQNNIDAYKCDVGDYDSCSKMISKIYDKYKTIDILVNNAGITRDAPLHKMTQENWKRVIDVNPVSYTHLTLPTTHGV